MEFSIYEWIRLLCYACAMPSCAYLALRSAHRRDGITVMMWGGLALMFSWYLVDLTLVSAGASSRETRNMATPLIVFATGGIVSVAIREIRQHWGEKKVRCQMEMFDMLADNDTQTASESR